MWNVATTVKIWGNVRTRAYRKWGKFMRVAGPRIEIWILNCYQFDGDIHSRS